MVTIISNEVTTQAPQQTGNIGQFFVQNAGAFILGILLLIAIIVIYFIWKKWEDERREREDPVYEAYKKQKSDAMLNANKRKIKKTYSLANLFFLGIPIIWNEHSSKIVNYTNELIGYYRGESFSMDGYMNYVLYKKKFFFMEELFVLKCPWSLNVKVKVKDENGNYITKNNKFVLENKTVTDFQDYIIKLQNGDIKILCTNIEKKSYFAYPVYLSENKTIVDYREIIGEDLVELTHSTMNSRILSLGAQQVEKAMLHNPNVKYGQLLPEKTKDEQND